MSHTPGPWKVTGWLDVHYEPVYRIVPTDGYGNIRGDGPIGDIFIESVQDAEANVCLITSAPKLLEVLEWLDNEFDCRDDDYGGVLFTREDFKKVRAAIIKARGEE